MSNKENDIKNILHSKLDDYKLPVRSNLWSSIEAEVVNQKLKKRKRILFSAWSAVAAILLLVILTIPLGENGQRFAIALSEINSTQIHNIEIAEENIQIPRTHNTRKRQNYPEINGTLLQKQNPPKEEPVIDDSNTVTAPPDRKGVADNSQKNDTKKQKNNIVYEEYDDFNTLIPKHKKRELLAIAINSNMQLQNDRQQIGSDKISGNLNSGSTSSEKESYERIEYDYDLPINIGLSVRKNINNKFAIESGISYTYLSSRDKTLTEQEILSTRKTKIHFIGIPIKGIYTLYDNNKIAVYGAWGGMVEKSVKATQETWMANKSSSKKNLDISQLQFSVLGAIGIEYNIVKHWGIYLEPEVDYFFDDKSDIETIRKDKPFNFNIRGGIRFSY